MSAYLSGFGLGFSLILAIGAQNAFVLKQGLKQEHVFIVCFLCALSDSVLISFGVLGFGILMQQFPWVESAARYGGFVFLMLYGLKSFWTAWSMSHHMTLLDKPRTSLYKTALITLAFTWLNPHVYLDTFVLLGSVSTKFQGNTLEFALGAISASFVFFFSLGYGAKILIPLFSRAQAWKILEVLIGIIMVTLAISLLLY